MDKLTQEELNALSPRARKAYEGGEGFDVRRTFQNYAVLEAQSNCRNRCLYRKESKR